MLGQIRRHIAKKNEKLFYIFVLFIVAFGISIVHYMFLEKDAVLSLKQDDVSSTYYAKYHYLSKNVNNITFYFQYEKDGEIIQDVLGSYEINNHFDIKNIFKGYSADANVEAFEKKCPCVLNQTQGHCFISSLTP